MGADTLRILQILRAPVGGLFRHVADLTGELARRGHAVAVVADSSTGDPASEEKLARLAEFAKLGVHRLPMARLLGASDLTTPFKIKALAKSLDISILHGHGAKGGFSARLARLGNSGTRAFYTPHGGALHYDPKKPTGRIFMAIERGLLSATDALIFESAYAQRTFAAHVGGAARRQAVIHNGLALAEFEPVAASPDGADFVYVGELRLLKGIDLLVEALAPLTRPDGTPATLVMAGDGPDREALVQRIAALGLNERVHLAGVQPARDMFAQGQVVVVPSRAESLPYIVLEAAAAGRPIIATQVGGIAEIFGPTSDALIAPDDVIALRLAMQAALAEPGAIATRTRERLAFVRDRFSLERMVDDIEALYRELA